MPKPSAPKAARPARELHAPPAGGARQLQARLLAGGGVAVVILAVIFALNNLGGADPAAKTGLSAFAVGRPGPGQVAPAIDLESTMGGMFNLAAQRGKTTLLYFQEGLTCEPCWAQLKDLDSHLGAVTALGINQIVSITTDPLDALRQKATDEAIPSPVLSDENLTVSTAYDANRYGMMGSSRDGHSFVVVGPNGQIRWRADYGGPPNYTMYVPVPSLITAIRQGLATGQS